MVQRCRMPSNPNIISSHVLFKWKDEGTPHQYLKARMVPHENRDNEKNQQETSSPCIKPDMFKLLISYAAEHGYDVCLIDIKTAFLQTGGINRLVFVKPPRETHAQSDLYWKLEKTTYGLVDGPIKCFRTCKKKIASLGYQILDCGPYTWCQAK